MGTVAFTGYRPNKLPFVEDTNDSQYIAFRNSLKRVIERLIELGYTDFISGVAVGFDTWAAEEVIANKRNNKTVSLECAIPCPGQDKKWSLADKFRRKRILWKADLKTETSKYYHSNCYFVRNEYMVDKADVVVCCYDGQSGGTARTVSYAKKKDKIIIQIDPNDAKVTIISRRGFE